MSLFDSASICITPNGVKEGKLYSIKPTDGSGDLSVTRATTATRVNSAGLVEVVPVNLFEYSEQFDNAYWTKDGATISANATTSPNGYVTADKLNETATTGVHRVGRATFPAGTQRTFSVFAKKSERNFVSLFENNSVGNTVKGVIFNLNTGVVSLNNDTAYYFNPTIQDLGNGWYRCSVNWNPISLSVPSIGCSADGLTNSYVGVSGNGIFIYGAQIVEGSSAKDYYPTTTRLNIPRLDYTNGSCPSILVEPQRTNNAQYSQEFDNAYWTKTNVTLTSTNGGIISGGNYFTITCDGTVGTFKGVSKNFINASANTYTLSVFAKAGNSSTFVVSSRAGLGFNDARAIFNLSNGTIIDSNAGTATITPYSDGWYRCSFTVVNAGTFTNQASFFFGHPHGAANGATVLAMGAMSEIGSYPTSYIPTTSASVTRNADFLTRAGFGNTSTSGTLLFDLYAENISSSAGEYILQLFAGAIITDAFFSTANSISIIANGTSIQIFNNGFTQLVQSITPTQGQRVKIAIRYNGTNISSSINGTVSSVLTDTSVGVKNAIRINNGQFSTHAFNSVVFIPEYLTNEQLIQLTTI